MSYILDALRRSQAERERGQVPGLGTQPVAAASSSLVRPRLPPGLWLLVGASVLVLLAGAAAVSAWWARGSALPAQPPAAVESGAAPTVASPSGAPANRDANAAPSPAAQFPTVVSAPPTAVAAARQASPAGTAAIAATAASAPAPAAAGTAAAAAAPSGTNAIPLTQLSAEQRRELPPLAVSGSIWSENPASRFVMINGQVVREGDTVAPGLTLERIAPKAAVLRWRDLRIEVAL